MPTVTAQAITDQRDPLAMPITTIPLRIPRRRATRPLHILYTLMDTCTRGRLTQPPRLRPDYPRQETVVDRVVRLDLYLYTRSLSG
jgi:hypothetical protein